MKLYGLELLSVQFGMKEKLPSKVKQINFRNDSLVLAGKARYVSGPGNVFPFASSTPWSE